MTTNTKAITECSSCCWIIYCKYYLTQKKSNWIVVKKKKTSRCRVSGGRKEKRSAIWAVSVKAEMFTIFFVWVTLDFVERRLFSVAALKMRRKTLLSQSRVVFLSLTGCKQEGLGIKRNWMKVKNELNMNFLIPAKNQGLTITKNSTSTTLHNDQTSSQGSSNARFNVETTSINGFQTNKNELDIAMLQILDPHLRPVPPLPNEPTSQKIYKEHMDLAQEYFKVGVKLIGGWHLKS